MSNEQSQKLSQVPPTVPFRWQPVPRDDWPFTDARDEYLKSRFLFSAPQLIRRWEGVEGQTAERIHAFLASPTIRQARDETQIALSKGLVAPELTPEHLAQLNARRRLQVGDEIDRTAYELETRTTVQVEHVFVEGKMETVELHKPLSNAEIRARQVGMSDLIKTERLLNGEATEIVDLNQKQDTLTVEAIVQEELAKNPRFAMLQAIARGEVIEGEIVPALPEAQTVVIPNSHS